MKGCRGGVRQALVRQWKGSWLQLGVGVTSPSRPCCCLQDTHDDYRLAMLLQLNDMLYAALSAAKERGEETLGAGKGAGASSCQQGALVKGGQV